MANLVSTRPIFASSAKITRMHDLISLRDETHYKYSLHAILRSHAKDISRPPPRAYPSMAAITGTGNSDITVTADLMAATYCPTLSAGIVALSFKSAPYENQNKQLTSD